MERPLLGPSDWAPGVSSVPFRAVALSELAKTSGVRGWGFDRRELARIRDYYRKEGRDPTDVEIAALAQSWSEHCSYKTSRPFLRRSFGRLRRSPRVLGTGDAGVIAFGGGFAYALRIESHNHPSAVEPYGGAATGIGGILRDVLAVGGKPIALADPLFFGPLDLPREEIPSGVKSPNYLFSGVVAGIRDYGNRVGVPTVSGTVYFDPDYVVNPLVNVGCVGWLPRRRLVPNRAKRAGDHVVLVGGLTGRDGIGGVAFASRELGERSEAEDRGAVQLGNPIAKEPLIHACLEALDRRLISGMKDLGGGGLSTASAELAHAGGLGIRIDLARVPCREEGLLPWEIWISESQERMVLDVPPSHLEEVRSIFDRFDVPFADLGEFIHEEVEELSYHGRPAADLRIAFRVDPELKRRPTRRPRAHGRAGPVPIREDPAALFRSLVLDPQSRSREGVIRVYDHMVQGRTVLAPLQGRVDSPSHGDAAVLKPRADSWRGLAVAVATGPEACRLDPEAGAVSVVEEAARNLYAVGALPDAFTNCLNFGNPEDPRVLGAFDSVTRGLARGARALGFAVPSGNVSFYNGGIGHAIPPTPVLMATGIVPDVRRALSSEFKNADAPLYVVGRSHAELGGSLWARRSGRFDLALPSVNPRRVRALGERLVEAGRRGLLSSAHDISEGGAAVTLAEMAFGARGGFEVDLAALALPSAQLALAAEGGSRWVIEGKAGKERSLERVFRGLPLRRIGGTRDADGTLRWKGERIGAIDLRGLYSEWRRGPGAA